MDYYIEDARARARENPATFTVPDEEDIKRLSAGDFVKVILIPKVIPEGAKLRGERPWVCLEKVNRKTLKGFIDNDPVLGIFKHKDKITLKPEHIAGIHFKPGKNC